MNSVDPAFQQTVRNLLAEVPVKIEVDSKGIDLSDFGNLNTALTALVHLGYLSYQDGSGRRVSQYVGPGEKQPGLQDYGSFQGAAKNDTPRGCRRSRKTPTGESRHILQCLLLQPGE